MRTRVGIVGAGPAGLALALMLERAGIESVVIECQSRAHVESRVRAGLLEQNTVDLMHGLGVGERLAREGLVHEGILLRSPGGTQRIDIAGLTDRRITIYGQQELVKDLIAARLAAGGEIHFQATGAALHGLDGEQPSITFVKDGATVELYCDAIAGCDGFHGVSRASIPEGVLREYEHVYPFAWLGILAEAEPTTDELIYAWHERGFALYSMRSPQISRLYLQVPAGERIDDWSDERIWAELRARLGGGEDAVNEGPVIDRGVTAVRSFVCEPLRYGRLFLLGDAAHIVPPTGAKGLNLAVNDARLLAATLATWFAGGPEAGLDDYSTAALRRVWRVQDFSNYMTHLLHDLGGGAYERRLQLARLEQLSRSTAAARTLAENYAGLPASADF